MKKGILKHIALAIAIFIGVNILSSYIYKRLDLTQDKRYTLSEEAKAIIDQVDNPIVLDVYLEGSFPPEFRRLQAETEQLLEEFSAINPNIRYDFTDPMEVDNSQALLQEFSRRNMTGAQIQVREGGKVSTETVFPWALAQYNGQTIKIPLLKNQLGATSEERVNSSIQNLEYAFADGFKKLVTPKSKKIAILKGNGELGDAQLADFLKTIGDYYHIAPFTLDSAEVSPKRTLDQLNTFDLIIVAQPMEPFSDNEKLILDQYIMNGGASLWLIDATQLRRDPESGNTFGFGMDLNLNDFFFKYGLRVNPNLVKDIYSAPIVLASGEDREAQYNQYPWFYYPLSSSGNNHPIVTNIEAVKFQYASGIDILENDIEKTVLLSSSPISQEVGLPAEINMDVEIPKNLKVVNEGPDMNVFNAGEIPLAVLLEGQFTSVFQNRIKPFSPSTLKETSPSTKMVVVSDGDVIANQLDRNRPLELGFDKWTGNFYGNKDFLLNTVNYLLDDSGLINIRSKEIAIPFLDPQKTANERGTWQLVNILLPLVLLGLFGIFFHFYRTRKYGR
ncbi:gliding motility-associated ABC transporter substrate-binding protein GldG [Luteirhabdus pelagi]|uniref:gliding motility-associated ABC transporter substrate-binding protein GldG n=1 Tax=Luteirhabdus pelagi TaxID=2792783 RepID=UPI0019396369|nr:gliding motility-associated ABC transporter substrate-binding protein GldG [Luteirhabdus pelagi]